MLFWTIISVIVGLLLFYILRSPVPPNLANPLKYRIFAIVTTIMADTIKIKAWLTGKDLRLVTQETINNVLFKGRHTHPDVKVTEDEFDGIHVYIYQRHGDRKNRPGLIYYHGGGFAFGHPIGYEGIIRAFVKKLDVVVMAPVYRLTPNSKAPAPHEDCKTATNHFFQNADKFGVNPKLIGSVGDSAGGNLAAAMCLMMKDQKKHQFAFQVLIYPWLQGIDQLSPSRIQNYPLSFFVLNSESVTSFLGSFLGADPKYFDDISKNKHVDADTWERYKKYLNIDDLPPSGIPANYRPVRPSESQVNQQLAAKVQAELLNPHLWPLMADDLSKLPPAFVLTVESDPLRDEGVWYVKRLERAGVKVKHFHSPDGFHAMMGFLEPPVVFDAGIRALDRIMAFVGDFVNH